MKTQLFDRNGVSVRCSSPLAQGGEGTVYDIKGRSGWVAKIYHRPPSPEKVRKLEAMVDTRTTKLVELSSWPVQVLSRERGGPCVGVVMPKITGFQDIHLLYGPRTRLKAYPNAGWDFLIHTATNLARAFAVVHDHGHVVGDVNDKVALVSDGALVRLVDCDGFQIIQGREIFPCDVGVLTHQPPEFQNLKSFRGLHRTPNHDNFGLAVLIFQLLFLGRHPFSGRYQGRGEMPIERAIHEFRFAYGAKAAKRKMKPPPATLSLDMVAPEVAQLFERAFEARGAKQGRPTAREWVTALKQMAQGTRTCRTNPNHSYWRSNQNCPICALERKTRLALFNIPVQFKTPKGNKRAVVRNVGDLWKEIKTVAPPKEAPEISPLSPLAERFTGEAQRRRIRWKQRAFWLLSGSLVLSSAFLHATAGPWAGWGILGLSLPLWKRRPGRLDPSLDAARTRWDQALFRWEGEATSRRFRALQLELKRVRGQLEDLDSEYDRKLRHLESRRQEAQQNEHLLRTDLAAESRFDARLIRRLSAQQITSAFDVGSSTLEAIEGISAEERKALLQWRREAERSFRYDPKRELPKSALESLEQEIRQRRAELIRLLAEGPRELRRVKRSIQRDRKSLKSELSSARKQLENAVQEVA